MVWDMYTSCAGPSDKLHVATVYVVTVNQLMLWITAECYGTKVACMIILCDIA